MIGHKIARVREVLGIKQEDLAKQLNTSQQMISKLEKKEIIGNDQLAQIAKALGVTPESIKQFNEASLVTNINQQGGNGSVININPLEKIIELYEEKLQAKDKKITQLQNKIAKLKPSK